MNKCIQFKYLKKMYNHIHKYSLYTLYFLKKLWHFLSNMTFEERLVLQTVC